jgi:hypothetical protein
MLSILSTGCGGASDLGNDLFEGAKGDKLSNGGPAPDDKAGVFDSCGGTARPQMVFPRWMELDFALGSDGGFQTFRPDCPHVAYMLSTDRANVVAIEAPFAPSVRLGRSATRDLEPVGAGSRIPGSSIYHLFLLAPSHSDQRLHITTAERRYDDSVSHPVGETVRVIMIPYLPPDSRITDGITATDAYGEAVSAQDLALIFDGDEQTSLHLDGDHLDLVFPRIFVTHARVVTKGGTRQQEISTLPFYNRSLERAPQERRFRPKTAWENLDPNDNSYYLSYEMDSLRIHFENGADLAEVELSGVTWEHYRYEMDAIDLR